jgi:1-acyl-sn-glycerol-3-phosphate acyltransferase
MNGGQAALSLPPVRNRPLYVYRVLIKALFFLIFGAGTLILVFPVLPAMILLFHPREQFQRYARRLVSFSFRGFIRMMRVFRVLELETGERHIFKNLQSKIVVANHPSLLDVLMMISLIPNADVIVRGNLVENPIVSGVVRRLYILNSLDFETLTAACKESLARGNCIVIFPEGTRTPRSGEMRLKKGAARISLLTGAEIVAVRIGGTDKYGLGKHEPFISFNHTDKYIYRINIAGYLNPEKYARLEPPRAVRRLNTEILSLLRGTGS